VDEYGLIDLKQVVAVLENDPSIKFLVPVHLYGHSVNLVELRRIRECFGLKIVEDCAQSIGASNSNIKVGTVGQLAATSFYPTKNLGALGDGGAILTNIKALADVCSCIRDYGQSAKYRHDMLGMNSRLDELQAAVLDSVMLPRLSDSNQARANIAKKYLCLIDNISLKPLGAPPDTVSAWHLFPIFVKGSRDDFRAHLETKTISSSIHYPLLCNSQLATNFFDYEVSPNGLQNAEKICQSVVSIPLHPHMHESEVKKVINACNSW
jgi:dTDP-3-amino-3,4,6-trideoxy-alpha-D-glucose transaminase